MIAAIVSRGVPTVIAEPDDVTLLTAIARQRDEQAFSALYERYHVHAFGLAFQISRNSDLAEEAVQEAMARIWQRAESFVPEGSARGWILRIVARETLMLLRQKRKGARIKEKARAGEFEEEQNSPAPAESAERSELLDGLRRVLDRLSHEERLLVTLYYGAGMSQQEIGTALEMPRTTVTKHMQDGLAALRQALERAGFVAALPLLNAEGFGELCTQHVSIPAGLQEKVILRIASDAATAVSRRAAVPIAKTSSWTAGIAAVLVATSVGAGTWWWKARSPSTNPSASASASASANTSTNETAGLLARWQFHEGPPKDFELVMGHWNWIAPAGKSPGAMRATTTARALLPLRLPNQPHRIAFRFTPQNKSATFFYTAFRTDGERVPATRIWRKTGLKINPQDELSIHYYILDRFVVCRFPDGPIVYVEENNDSILLDQIALSFVNLDVREIEVRSLARNELPAFLKDIPALAESLSVTMEERYAAPLRSSD